MVDLTNIGIRSAPLLARTVAGLSALSDRRIVLGIGAGSLWDELARLGVPPRSPAESGPGHGRDDHRRACTDRRRAARGLHRKLLPTSRGGPRDRAPDLDRLAGTRSLAVTGRLADGWIPPTPLTGGLRWLQGRAPLIDEAAVAAGRDPSDVATIYNVGGQITDRATPKPRDEDGHWIGGSTGQWIDELTSAVFDYDAAGIFYLPVGQPESAIHRWMHEIVPEVRRAITESTPNEAAPSAGPQS